MPTPGWEILDLALHVDKDNHYLLDPVAAGGDTRVLIQKFTRQVIESLQPLPVETLRDPGRESDAARLNVARYYESDTQEALQAALELPESDWTLTRALGPTDREPLVVVCDAHRLPTQLLWELRELAPFSAVGWRYLSCSGQGGWISSSSRIRCCVGVRRSSRGPLVV